MPVTYTNRKCHTYYLCLRKTKTGKMRYYFARELIEESPDQIPEGYKISESVNGVVSLVKDGPQLIMPQEVASVEAVLVRHPKSRDYRVAFKNNQIVIYERLGPDIDKLSVIFGKISALQSDMVKMRLQEQLDNMARFRPILRFILIDPEERKFRSERWIYMGDINDWIDIGESGKLEKLARDGQQPYTVESAMLALQEKVARIKPRDLATDLLPMFESRQYIEAWLDAFHENFQAFVKNYLEKK